MKIGISFMALIGCVLAGCGPAPNDPGPGGVTVGEAEALDEAAEMLDARNAPPQPATEQQQAGQASEPAN